MTGGGAERVRLSGNLDGCDAGALRRSRPQSAFCRTLVWGVAALALTACGGGESNAPSTATAGGIAPAPAPTPSPTPTPGAFSSAEAYTVAIELWRDDDLAQHPKGSCAGCHGPDFIDLARIGSTDADIQRRALIDGATDRQARALVKAVSDMRVSWKMPTENARAFRPFQPGGQVLVPNTTQTSRIASVERDIAFGEQLRRLTPTLFGGPIDTLAKAQRARAELMDLIEGTNAGGSNPRSTQLRDLPTGIEYPRWSADLHHSARDEGTFNDWIADIARDANPQYKAEWRTLQDTYLANPNSRNFWRMYHSAKDMTEAQLLGECTFVGTNAHLACAGAIDFNKNKFLSTLIGHHMIRAELSGDKQFIQGPLAFSYLDNNPTFDFMLDRSDKDFLPANPWEIGDRGRVMLDNSRDAGTFRRTLTQLGFPDFVLNSIDPDRSVTDEQQLLRLSWFWIGFTMDPSFARIHPSNATKVGEYMVASLSEENMFIHNTFQANVRLLARGYLPQANVKRINRETAIEMVAPQYQLNYSYFIAYNRTVLRWAEKAGAIPTGLKTEQEQLWQQFTGNAFRMSLYLYDEALSSGKSQPAQTALDPIAVHFNRYQPENAAHDTMLIQRVRTASGST